MNANSIVYTSNTGYTAEYARLLGEKYALLQLGHHIVLAVYVLYAVKLGCNG